MSVRLVAVCLLGALGGSVLPQPAPGLVPPSWEGGPPFAAAILVEAESGKVLFEHHGSAPRSPASTLKLLLQLLVMEAVADGRVALSDSVHISAEASRTGGSQVYLKEGEVFTLEELMETIVIASANDACVAVAEHIGGTEQGFVDLMNSKAAVLGLEGTRCVNVHGLDNTPPTKGNTTTAADLAKVSREIVAYDDIMEWSRIRQKPFRNGTFILRATNRLLGKFRGLDGLKTGYTKRAGYCLVATAERRKMRLISVVLGSRSERARYRETRRILDWGFNHYSRVAIVSSGDPVAAVSLDWGVEPEVAAVATDSVVAVLGNEEVRGIRREVEIDSERTAPVAAGDSLGTLRVTTGETLLAAVDLVAQKTVQRMSLWEILMSYF